jgi:fibronectin type 3 domain-containing protein
MVFRDTLDRNYLTYTYRVRGINPFGQRSEWREVVVKGVDLTAPKAPEEVFALFDPKTKAVKITWKKTIKEGDLAGFIIGRSDRYEGPYVPISDRVYGINTIEAVDLKPVSHLRNFYVVTSIDTAGNSGRSVPAYAILTDSIPPSQPIGLKAQIDSLGVVSLSWQLGKELDLAGYNIYRANSSHEEFSIINKSLVLANEFTDMVDVNSLTKTAFYKIVAFDKSNNPSQYSLAVKVLKPDYLPPVPPQIKDFWVTNTEVKLTFMPSSSADLKAYQVYRKTDSLYQKIADLAKTDTVFYDKDVADRQVMWYFIKAVDIAGLISEQSFPQKIVMPTKGVSMPLLKLVAKKVDNAIEISWDSNAVSYDGVKLLLYKSYDSNALEQFKLVDYKEQKFIDSEMSANLVKYAVRLVNEKGVMSNFSPIVEVVIVR